MRLLREHGGALLGATLGAASAVLGYGLVAAEVSSPKPQPRIETSASPTALRDLAPTYVGRCSLYNLTVQDGQLSVRLSTGPADPEDPAFVGPVVDYTARAVTVTRYGRSETVVPSVLPEGGRGGANTSAMLDLRAVGTELGPTSVDLVAITANSSAGNIACGGVFIEGGAQAHLADG